MAPTKYYNITNENLILLINNITASKENGDYYLINPLDTMEIMQEVKNRLEELDKLRKVLKITIDALKEKD